MNRPPDRAEPLISVLMPVRNEQRHVRAALESVLAQNVSLEVLVVDAMSTDATRDVVESFGDPRIRILDNPRRVIPAALNLGLAQARGRFVARVDGHMRIAPGHLAAGLAVLAADPQVAAVGGIRIAEASSPTGRAIATALGSPFGVGNSVNHYATTAQDTDHASCGMYRVEVARGVGGWDEELLVNEDVDFDHRIVQAGYRIRFDPRMKAHWRVRESLPAFARQYRRYGRGKAGMVRKNGRGAVRARHLAAPVLVGVLSAAAAAAASGRPRVATALVAPYVGAIGVATARTLRDQRSAPRARKLVLAAAFATMHITWGIGFLEGYLLGRPPAAATSRDPRATVNSATP
ncbi:MAG TPA: glycosyltransferase family 2 protein [Nakamurella sp.]